MVPPPPKNWSSINVDWARSKLSSSTWFPYTYRARQRYRARFLTVCLSIENGKRWKSNNGQHLRWIKKVRITPYSPCVVPLFVFFFPLAHLYYNMIIIPFCFADVATSISWLAEHLSIFFFFDGGRYWLSIVNFNKDAKPLTHWILREFDVPRIRPRLRG